MSEAEAYITKEVLREMDGQTVPFTEHPGGREVGMAELSFDEATGSIVASVRLHSGEDASVVFGDQAIGISIAPAHLTALGESNE